MTKETKFVYPIETSTYCRTLVAFAQITWFVKMSGLDGPDILFLSSWDLHQLASVRCAYIPLALFQCRHQILTLDIGVTFFHVEWMEVSFLITRCLVATQVCFPDCHNVLSALLRIGNTPVFYMDFTSRVHPMHLTYIQESCGFSSSHKNLLPNLFTLMFIWLVPPCLKTETSCWVWKQAGSKGGKFGHPFFP